MRGHVLNVLLVLFLAGVLASKAIADFSTPFLEGPDSKVGAVSEKYGYILADESDDGPTFRVLVMSDTSELIAIVARAEKGVVPANLIGRQVRIKAEVVKSPTKSGHGEGAELKILGVIDGRKPKN